jgi:hypothetical protein
MNADLHAVSGLDVALDANALALAFGPGLLHPDGERRFLADVRATLAEPEASGPDHLYTIYMDVCRAEDRAALVDQSLLYGAVAYNHGLIGRERLRSQGHRHSRKPGTELRYSEVYEFWTGRGLVYLQKERYALLRHPPPRIRGRARRPHRRQVHSPQPGRGGALRDRHPRQRSRRAALCREHGDPGQHRRLSPPQHGPQAVQGGESLREGLSDP